MPMSKTEREEMDSKGEIMPKGATAASFFTCARASQYGVLCTGDTVTQLVKLLTSTKHCSWRGATPARSRSLEWRTTRAFGGRSPTNLLRDA
jgi:hypothetical protein